MSQERPTVRPVTLARLVEVTHLCTDNPQITENVENELEVTRRRARETILEACRIGLLSETETIGSNPMYQSTARGKEFVEAIRAEEWTKASSILEQGSPHYGTLIEYLGTVESATLEEILSELSVIANSQYSYNQTSVEVIGDWGERLGVLQRNAFSGSYYMVRNYNVSEEFPEMVLSVFEEIEEKTGVRLRQRYLSIPKLREYTCEKLSLPREAFDAALVSLAQSNVGKVELSGAPIDTGAKDAKLGIKEIDLDDEGEIVTTSHSTDQVMRGVEQFGKQYYFLAVYDHDLEFHPEQ